MYKFVFKPNVRGLDDEVVIKTCGEDEHVFPPGIGNLLGTLYHNKDYSMYGLNSPLSLSHFGIYASHSLCNQAKNRTYFYKIDRDTGEFKSNDENIKNFLDNWYRRRWEHDIDQRKSSGHQRELIFQRSGLVRF